MMEVEVPLRVRGVAAQYSMRGPERTYIGARSTFVYPDTIALKDCLPPLDLLKFLIKCWICRFKRQGSRSESARIALNGEYMLLSFPDRLPGVLLATAQSVFLINATKRMVLRGL